MNYKTRHFQELFLNLLFFKVPARKVEAAKWNAAVKTECWNNARNSVFQRSAAVHHFVPQSRTKVVRSLKEREFPALITLQWTLNKLLIFPLCDFLSIPFRYPLAGSFFSVEPLDSNSLATMSASLGCESVTALRWHVGLHELIPPIMFVYICQ